MVDNSVSVDATGSKKSLLYIGSLNPWSNSFRRFEALSNLFWQIKGINTDPFILARYISGIQHYYNIGIGIYLLNKKIRKQVKIRQPDVIWVDNKNYVSLKTLHYVKEVSPQTKIINLLTDDPFGDYKSSWRLLNKTARFYDIFFVQREQNIRELKEIGAARVELCYRSYAPDFNRSLNLNETDKSIYSTPVGFVGSYEAERAGMIAYLIENGVPVKVTGNGWPGKDHWKTIQPFYVGPSVYGDEYIKMINGMEIALHFLRKGNRDEQDSRTFEIPSCKVFMLAEYSEVHASLFIDGEEAIFFRSKEELLEKVKYYLHSNSERNRIALNGFNRCVTSGYDHYHTLKKVLERTGVTVYGN